MDEVSETVEYSHSINLTGLKIQAFKRSLLWLMCILHGTRCAAWSYKAWLFTFFGSNCVRLPAGGASRSRLEQSHVVYRRPLDVAGFYMSNYITSTYSNTNHVHCTHGGMIRDTGTIVWVTLSMIGFSGMKNHPPFKWDKTQREEPLTCRNRTAWGCRWSWWGDFQAWCLKRITETLWSVKSEGWEKPF